jgi:hypothetical protein
MRLTFERAGVLALLAHTRAASKRNAPYSVRTDDEPIGPKLWLVGDQGVYLISNGGPMKTADGKIFVVYADQINPAKVEFDTWYARKRRAFGGDDGIETIDAEDIEKALATYPEASTPLQISLTPRQIALIEYAKKPTR